MEPTLVRFGYFEDKNSFVRNAVADFIELAKGELLLDGMSGEYNVRITYN